MPFLTIFVAATEVHLGIDAAILQEGQTGDGEAWIQGDVESAVTIEEGGVRAVFLQVLLIGEEHGDLGAVLAEDKDLLGGVVFGLEIDFGSTEHGGGVGVDVILEHGHRIDEGSEAVVDFLFIVTAAEPDLAEGGQVDLMQLLSVQGVHEGMVGSVLVEGDDHLAGSHLGSDDDVLGFGDDLLPVGDLRGLGRHTADTAFVRTVVREDIDLVVHDLEGAVEIVLVIRDPNERI